MSLRKAQVVRANRQLNLNPNINHVYPIRKGYSKEHVYHAVVHDIGNTMKEHQTAYVPGQSRKRRQEM